MTSTSRNRIVPFVIATAALCTEAKLARADDKTECLQAHVDGQIEQKAGHLRRATEHYAVCTRSVCPATVQKECYQLLSTSDADLGSIVLETTREGRPVTDLRVIIDGQPVASSTGGVLLVDPGERVLRLEEADGRFVERRVIFVRGEKNRHIALALDGEGSATAEGPGRQAPGPRTNGEAPAPPPPARPESPRPVPTPTWVLGGVAFAGVATFTAFGLAGMSREAELGRCAPTCAPSTVDGMYDRYLVADVALAIGVAAAIASAVILLAR